MMRNKDRNVQVKPVLVGNMVYTAAIIFTEDASAAPWISSFATREARDAFVATAKAKVEVADAGDRIMVVGDSGPLDDASYLYDL